MIEQFLTDNGWKCISQCHCGGRRQRKYWNQNFPTYKIAVFYINDTCVILNNNRRYIPHDVKAENIEQTLKDHGLIS